MIYLPFWSVICVSLTHVCGLNVIRLLLSSGSELTGLGSEHQPDRTDQRWRPQQQQVDALIKRRDQRGPQMSGDGVRAELSTGIKIPVTAAPVLSSRGERQGEEERETPGKRRKMEETSMRVRGEEER